MRTTNGKSDLESVESWTLFFIRFVGIFRLNWCLFRKAFLSWVRALLFSSRIVISPKQHFNVRGKEQQRERIAIPSRGNFEIFSFIVQTSMLYIRFSSASKSLLRDSINILFVFSSSSKWCHLTIYWKWRFQTLAFLLESFSVLFFHSLLRFTDTARVFA